MERCEYCNNQATRRTGNVLSWEEDGEPPERVDVCEIHYSYMKPRESDVNPVNIDRCMRCGCKSLNKRGKEERLIQHHINYDLDITIPVCDKCHGEIHSGEDRQYLENKERGNSPYEPRGSKMATGHAVSDLYRNDGRMTVDYDCPNCGTGLLDMVDMGQEEPYICPNSMCSCTAITYYAVKKPEILSDKYGVEI